MSRGKKVFFTSLALLSFGSFLMQASPALAGPVAGEDNLAPGPVGEVSVEADLGAVNVAVFWTLADDDNVRQAPTGTDLSSGGSFVNTNDVAGYVVWRQIVGGELEEIAVVGYGETSYVDETVSAGLSYSYLVTAIDASGNESEPVESIIVNLGPPPSGGKPEVPPGSVVSKVARLKIAGDLIVPPFVARVVTPPAPPAAPTAEEVDAYLDEVEAQQEEVLGELEPEQRSAALSIRGSIARAAGIDERRVLIKGVRSGSLIVDFEILDLGDADTEVSAEDAVADLESAIESDPETFANDPELASVAANVGAVEEVVSRNATSVDFGAIAVDDFDFEIFTFTNTADDPEAVLSISTVLSGSGYTVSPATLSLAVGETGEIELEFDAASVGNVNGDYPGLLTFLSNDPNQRATDVSLSASIDEGLDEAAIAVSGAVPANFGSVIIGTSRSLKINITNAGDLDLSADVALEGDAEFASDDAGSYSIAGGDTQVITVTFTPTVAGAASGELVITSDDANKPEVRVALSGNGAEAGDQQILVDADGNQLFGDLDGNGDINFDDFFIFADNFGLASPDPAADFDGNGAVNFDDFFLFADNFGKSGTYVSAG